MGQPSPEVGPPVEKRKESAYFTTQVVREEEKGGGKTSPELMENKHLLFVGEEKEKEGPLSICDQKKDPPTSLGGKGRNKGERMQGKKKEENMYAFVGKKKERSPNSSILRCQRRRKNAKSWSGERERGKKRGHVIL